MAEPEVRVSYGVKELLGRIDIRLESIDNKLDAKADLRELIELRNRFEDMERQWKERLTIEANDRKRAAQSFSKREKVVGLLVAIIAVVIQPIQQHFHF